MHRLDQPIYYGTCGHPGGCDICRDAPDAPLTVLGLLERARELLSDVRRWTKGAYARNAQHEPCEPQDDGACQYCLIGALALASGGGLTEEEQKVFGAAESALCALLPPRVGGLAQWNDYHARSHADVLALLDRAIETLEAGYPHGVAS